MSIDKRLVAINPGHLENSELCLTFLHSGGIYEKACKGTDDN